MMTFWKKMPALLLASALSLSLAACTGSAPAAGKDWRTTGIVWGGGTITRNGKDADVLVCVHTEDASLYYDAEEQVLFDSVHYPAALAGNVWEMLQSIDFADLNGDGNGDVTMRFNDGGNELLMVWFWDAEAGQFVYQPEASLPGGTGDAGE